MLEKIVEPSGFAAVSLMAKGFYLSERTRHFMGMQPGILCPSKIPLYPYLHLLPNDIASDDVRNFYLIVIINCIGVSLRGVNWWSLSLSSIIIVDELIEATLLLHTLKISEFRYTFINFTIKLCDLFLFIEHVVVNYIISHILHNQASHI